MPSTEEVFVCSCLNELKTMEDVDRHEKDWLKLGHHKQCPFPDCGKVSPQVSNAKRHWKIHLPAEMRTYYCQRCSAGYAKQQDLRKHEDAETCFYNRKRCRTDAEGPSTTRQNDRAVANEALEARIRELEGQQVYQELQRALADRDLALRESEDLKKRLGVLTKFIAHIEMDQTGLMQTTGAAAEVPNTTTQEAVDEPHTSLPSTRYMESFLPSPSTFYSDWFGRSADKSPNPPTS